MDGKTVLPFRLTYRVRGSSSLMVKPYGEITEVRMHSNCPDPSFTGDFLPSEREVGEEGFTARWSVSKINRGDPDDTSFGVNLLKGVTQYQQTTRSAKYGILIILLVFVAGLALELTGKKSINLVQYLVIGLSLVLFYALVLAFSEFMPFVVAYSLSALMTVGALFFYFRGILRDHSAWLLTCLVAVAYLLSYILIQMETYALIAGTLVLFALLAGVMYLTRNLNRPEKTDL
jgi:inner membrane protein